MMFLDQLRDFMILVLIAAALISGQGRTGLTSVRTSRIFGQLTLRAARRTNFFLNLFLSVSTQQVMKTIADLHFSL